MFVFFFFIEFLKANPYKFVVINVYHHSLVHYYRNNDCL